MIVHSKFQPNQTSLARVIYLVVYWCAIVIFWWDKIWVVFTCRDDCSLQISAQSDSTGSSYRLCGILVRHRNILVWYNLGCFHMSRWLFPPNFSPIGSQMFELRHVRYSIGCILYLKNRFFDHKYRHLCKFEKNSTSRRGGPPSAPRPLEKNFMAFAQFAGVWAEETKEEENNFWN